MDYVKPIKDIIEICASLDISFLDLENISFFNNSTIEDFVYLLGISFNSKDVEKIKSFVLSKLWFTYRKNFPAIGGTGPTSDKGWGCMMRCGQMLLAQALLTIHLGRSWKWTFKCKNYKYRRLLSMFQDKRTALFSIHQIAQMGVSEGKELCEWFGPNTIAQVLKKLVVYDDWTNLAVHVAMDNILISEDVEIMAKYKKKNCKVSSSKLDELEKKQTESEKLLKNWDRPLLIIVPLRLGLSTINTNYSTAIKEFFKLPQCAGMIGGRPNHALYFLGQTGNKLLYLDPHVCHDVANIEFDNNKTVILPTSNNFPIKKKSSLSFKFNQMINFVDGKKNERKINEKKKSKYLNTEFKENSTIKQEPGNKQKDEKKVIENAAEKLDLQTNITKIQKNHNDNSMNNIFKSNKLLEALTKKFSKKKEDDKNNDVKKLNDLDDTINELSKNVENDSEFDDSTYHCAYILHMNFEQLDPSLALAFLCITKEDYCDLVEKLNHTVLPSSSPPLFEILENRPKEWSKFIPYSFLNESIKLKEYDDFGDPLFDSDDNFEILE